MRSNYFQTDKNSDRELKICNFKDRGMNWD
jgi:hypothetical protein